MPMTLRAVYDARCSTPENQLLAISPGDRFRGRSLHQPPVMDGHGKGPPQTTFNQQLESSKNPPK
jgi:hypothetical protein